MEEVIKPEIIEDKKIPLKSEKLQMAAIITIILFFVVGAVGVFLKWRPAGLFLAAGLLLYLFSTGKILLRKKKE